MNSLCQTELDVCKGRLISERAGGRAAIHLAMHRERERARARERERESERARERERQTSPPPRTHDHPADKSLRAL